MAEHPITTSGAAPDRTLAGVEHGGGHAPEPTVFGLGTPAFVSLAMLAVIAILIWTRVPSTIARLLDSRIEGIRTQLDEAARLRAEAEMLRNEYRAKADAADAERQTMLDRARHEAQEIVEQARASTAALIERRSRMAEDRIAAAERQAIDEVRARAASAAAAAAAQLISEEVGADVDRKIVDKAIAELGKV